ncbi:MAG: hypothetical protein ACREFP_15400 [Acetobacteraceae bacterium]
MTTRARIELPFQDLIANSLHNHHLPTYFLLLAALAPGAGAWAMRLPSAIAGAFAATLGGAVGGTLGGRTAGLMSGLFLAAAPVMVQSGQDARPYAMELALLLLALWGLIRLAGDPDAAGDTVWRGRLGPWLAFLVGTTGALALSGDALPFLLVANLAAWPIAGRLPSGARWRFVSRWIATQVALLLLVAPLYIAMNHAVDGRFVEDFSWLPPPAVQRIWQVGATVYLLRGANMVSLELLPASLPGFEAVVPLFALVGFVALRRRPAAFLAMALAVLSLPALLFLAHPSHPFLLPRYLLWSGAVFLIVAGVGAGSLVQQTVPRFGLLAPAGLAVLLLVNLRPYYKNETIPRWDIAATLLASSIAAGAEVLADQNGAPMMLRAYLPGGDTTLPRKRVLSDLSEAKASLREGHTVIAVHGPVGQGRATPSATFLAHVAALGVPAQKISAGKDILLVRFNPPQASTPGLMQADVRSKP